MTDQPTTAAGRAYGYWVDPDEDHLRPDPREFPYKTVWQAIRAIEREAAAAALPSVEALAEAMVAVECNGTDYTDLFWDETKPTPEERCRPAMRAKARDILAALAETPR